MVSGRIAPLDGFQLEALAALIPASKAGDTAGYQLRGNMPRPPEAGDHGTA